MKHFWVFLIAFTLCGFGLFEPWTSGLDGMEKSIAYAHHKPWHTGGGGSDKCKKNPKKCQPPTVSELPIQYMILSGVALISLCGGMAFYIRKRKMKNATEA